jgi:ABC-type multidrug transport system fused ATPase/permease subunit
MSRTPTVAEARATARSARVQAAATALHRALADSKPPGMARVMWPLLRPYFWPFLLAVVFNAAHGFAITAQNAFPKWLVDDVILNPALDSASKLQAAAWLAVAYFLISVVGRMTLWHLGYRIFTWVRERMLFTLRSHFFRHVNHLCLRFHGRHSSGELFSYLFGSPLGQFTQFYQHSSMHVAGAVFTIISSVVLIGLWDPLLTVVLAVTAAASVVVMAQARKKLHRINKEYQETERQVSGHIADLLRGNRAVKIYALEDRVSEDFDRDAGLISHKNYRRDVDAHMQWMKQEVVNYVAYALLLVVCTWRCLGDDPKPGVAVAVLMNFQALVGAMTLIYTAATLLGGAEASIERIGEVLRTASTTPDPANRLLTSTVPEHGDIEFNGVTFRYEEHLPPVLCDINLRIPQGQKVALVGPSGAGKSTITQLILRLYDPQDGRITIDGLDLRGVIGTELRKRFGVVPQDPFIFNTTVRLNLKVVAPEADEAALRSALERANAWDFISRLPQGLDTVLGEGGANLSGGQRHRLAIARALLADPGFYIFDEATSALDTESERLIQATFERELGHATAFFIAHRLATVKNADRILVLQDGRIVQDGTYAALLAQPGLFRTLVEGQNLLN